MRVRTWLALGGAVLLWFLICGGVFGVLLRSARDLWLAALVAGSLAALGFLGSLVAILLRQLSLASEQQQRLQSLQAEWQMTQESLRQLLSQRDQLGQLVQLLRRFVLATNRKEVLTALLQELPTALRLDRAEVVIFNVSILHGMWDASDNQIHVREIDTRDRSTVPVWIQERLPRGIAQTREGVIVPVLTDDNHSALIRLSRTTPPFSTDELRFLEVVASQTALALERVKLIAFLERLSLTDPLTGVANRRHLEWRLSEEVARSSRYQYPLSALMLDIDHFKQVNDTYGHQVGDEVLKQLAQRLQQTLRRTDFIARYGGEEFLILAPQTPSDRALLMAERLRQLVANKPFSITPDLNLTITVSIGVAIFPDHAQNESELVKAADAALYRAKETGRNRVCLFEPAMAQGGGK